MAHKRKVVGKKKDIPIEDNPKIRKGKSEKKIDLSKQMTDFKKEGYKVDPLSNFEVEQFKELLKLSNNYAAVMKDISDKELMVIKMKEIVRQINVGKIKPPLWQEILPKTLAQFEDMEAATDMIKNNIKAHEDAIQFGKGQLGHRYEEYVDAKIRMRDRLTKRLGDAKVKRISPHRIGKDVDKKESEVFDEGFEKFIEEEAKRDKKGGRHG